MCDFWSSVTLVSGRYEGRPMAAHLRLKGVRPEHFDLWLRLFRQTAGEVCPGDVAAVFIVRAERIAESFQLGMFFRPENPESFPPPKQGSQEYPKQSPNPYTSSRPWTAWRVAPG